MHSTCNRDFRGSNPRPGLTPRVQSPPPTVWTVDFCRLPSKLTRSRRDRAVPLEAERRPSRGCSAVGKLPQSKCATDREDREHRQSEQDQNQRFHRDSGGQGSSDSSRTTGRPVEAPIGPLVGRHARGYGRGRLKAVRGARWSATPRRTTRGIGFGRHRSASDTALSARTSDSDGPRRSRRRGPGSGAGDTAVPTGGRRRRQGGPRSEPRPRT